MKLAAIAGSGLPVLASTHVAATADFIRTIAIAGISENTAFVQFAEGFSSPYEFNGLMHG